MKLVERAGILLITVAVVVLISRFLGPQQAADVSGSSAPSGAIGPAVLDQTGPMAPDRTQSQIEQLQKQLKDNPDNQVALTSLAAGYLQRARETGDPTYYNLAEQALNKSLALKPDDVNALVAKGSLMLSRHQFSDALAQGEKILGITKHSASVYGLIADAQVELGMYDQAVDTLQTMVNIRPDLSSYARVSYIRELYGDTQGAIDEMKLAV